MTATTTAPPGSRAALVSAALRHLRDAEHLAAAGDDRSLDQAWHLAGYAPECARKACLHDAWADQAIGHDLAPGAEALVDLAASLDPRCARYRVLDWGARWPVLGNWSPQARYEPTGTRDAAEVGGVLVAAQEAVEATVVELWSCGDLAPEALT